MCAVLTQIYERRIYNAPSIIPARSLLDTHACLGPDDDLNIDLVNVQGLVRPC